MNTIDELIYYCNEPEPVGALMLTGEWGCGKTYLIEHELSERLKDTHVIVRVSLFGISSVDLLNESVKKQWAAKCTSFIGEIQDKEQLVKAGKSIFGAIVSFVPVLKDIKDAILTINPYDYITISPEIDDGKRKVILVFDDLERSKLDTVDVLGCINEYCENLRFNTIIVANEERIEKKSTDNSEEAEKTQTEDITYAEIKEKIVCRTVEFTSDYKVIIRSIIENKEWPSDDYKLFLESNEQNIVCLFEANEDEGGNNTGKPHNIRSLKCALQDFHRIYQKLIDANIPDIEHFFYSFLAYTFAAKKGIVKEDNYGSLFSDDAVKKSYPFFNKSKFLTSSREWILYGRWNETKIDSEIRLLQEQLKPKEPKDVLRSNRFIDLEEEDIQCGFSDLLQDCYNGELTLNEYIEFIENSYYIRTYDIDVPEKIDWDKIITGIKLRLEKCIESDDDDHWFDKSITWAPRDVFTYDELKAYDLIEQFRRNGTAIFERNRKLYINTAQKDGIAVFTVCRNKRFNVFDSEMAVATRDCFDKCEQIEKCYFPGYFEGLWQFCVSSPDFKQKETKAGFETLIGLLEELDESYLDAGRKIASVHTRTFIGVVKELVEKLEVVINSEQEKQDNSNEDVEDVIPEIDTDQANHICSQQEKPLP